MNNIISFIKSGIKVGTLTVCLFISPAIAHAAESISLLSPDKHIQVSIQLGDTLSFSIIRDRALVLARSTAFLEFANTKKSSIGLAPRLKGKEYKKIVEQINAPFYRCSQFASVCNELNLKLQNGGVIFRAYNEGVAYRFYTNSKEEIIIKNEGVDYHFPKDYTAYLPYSTNDRKPLAMAYQNTYDVTPLSKAKQKPAFLPVTVDEANGLKVTLLESDLENYPGIVCKVRIL
jgi:Glycoside hydrolase 97.